MRPGRARGASTPALETSRGPSGRWAALGRLLRLSLAVSAVADVAAGVVLGLGGWPSGPAPWLLMLASLCVYHGGMALNDWADREADARLRPDRPIPAGKIAPSAALAVAAGLLLLGPLVALAVDLRVAAVLAGVAALAALYDLAGRGPWTGPLLLALCRAGNLGAGLALGRIVALRGGAPESAPLDLVAIPLLYSAYVFTVSRLGRLEDAVERQLLGRRPARYLGAAAAFLFVLPLMPLPGGLPDAALADSPERLARFLAENRILLAMLVASAGAFGLLRLAIRRGHWTQQGVLGAMGMALRRLIVFTAATAVVTGTPAGALVGAAILCGFPLSYWLRAVFPPS
jgi:hypothetical protein